MAAKHAWFQPWFHARVDGYDRNPPTSAVWPGVVEHVPAGFGAARAYAEERASSWYHQAVAEDFMGAWDGERGLQELRAYLGDAFDVAKLHGHVEAVDAEAAAVGDEEAFYRRSHAYLYDLTAFAMTGTKDVYRRELRRLVRPGGRLLDYGCGIGSDGLRLLEAGYAVEFADFDNPSVTYLKWRLAERGVSAPVHDIDRDVPAGFDLAYAFDVIEHVDDPFAFLTELESRAAIVVVNLLEPFPGETTLHRPLPIKEIVRHARRRGKLLHHGVYHGRSHLLAYRSPGRRRALSSPRAA
jgi:SAM-dependent methyltransferase